MKIAVYCEPLGVKTSGSPGRGMLRSLIHLRPADEFVLIVRKNYKRSEALVDLLSSLNDACNWQLHVEPRSRKMVNLLALFRIPNYGRVSIKADVYINMDCTALGNNDHPLIITVADLSVFKGKGSASYKSSISYLLRRFLITDGIRRSDAIVAISNTTRSDLISLFPTRNRNVEVVYNGIEAEWFDNTHRSEGFLKKSGDYWIWWGYISPRKNLEGLLRGYALLNKKRELPLLVLIYSNPGFPEALTKLIGELQLGYKISIRKYLPFNDLMRTVSFSKGLLFPSFIEGFGLPVIEAMATGVPVLTSSVSAMPEVAGGEAVLCDPNNVQSISEGLERMLETNMWSEERIAKRKRRASAFTFEEAAKGYSAIIDKVLQT